MQRRETYSDSTFCGDGGSRRVLTCNDTTAINVASAQVPEQHITMVMVNSAEYGGSSDGITAKLSTNPSSAEIALHEMGHLAFGFADEYDCRTCVAGETGHDHFSGSDPIEPNVTTNTDKTTIKWKSQLDVIDRRASNHPKRELLDQGYAGKPKGGQLCRRIRRGRLFSLRMLSTVLQLPHARIRKPVLRRVSGGYPRHATAVSAS